MSERLAVGEKVRRSAEYQRCYRHGRRRHGAYVTLHFVPNSLDHPRLGITATRRVGSAVVRNRLKRRTREIYRRWDKRSQLPGVDIVIHLKPAASEADFAALQTDVLKLCRGLIPKTAGRES